MPFQRQGRQRLLPSYGCMREWSIQLSGGTGESLSALAEIQIKKTLVKPSERETTSLRRRSKTVSPTLPAAESWLRGRYLLDTDYGLSVFGSITTIAVCHRIENPINDIFFSFPLMVPTGLGAFRLDSSSTVACT
jgi:hypothetical protein